MLKRISNIKNCYKSFSKALSFVLALSIIFCCLGGLTIVSADGELSGTVTLYVQKTSSPTPFDNLKNKTEQELSAAGITRTLPINLVENDDIYVYVKLGAPYVQGDGNKMLGGIWLYLQHDDNYLIPVSTGSSTESFYTVNTDILRNGTITQFRREDDQNNLVLNFYTTMGSPVNESGFIGYIHYTVKNKIPKEHSEPLVFMSGKSNASDYSYEDMLLNIGDVYSKLVLGTMEAPTVLTITNALPSVVNNKTNIQVTGTSSVNPFEKLVLYRVNGDGSTTELELKDNVPTIGSTSNYDQTFNLNEKLAPGNYRVKAVQGTTSADYNFAIPVELTIASTVASDSNNKTNVNVTGTSNVNPFEKLVLYKVENGSTTELSKIESVPTVGTTENYNQTFALSSRLKPGTYRVQAIDGDKTVSRDFVVAVDLAITNAGHSVNSSNTSDVRVTGTTNNATVEQLILLKVNADNSTSQLAKKENVAITNGTYDSTFNLTQKLEASTYKVQAIIGGVTKEVTLTITYDPVNITITKAEHAVVDNKSNVAVTGTSNVSPIEKLVLSKVNSDNTGTELSTKNGVSAPSGLYNETFNLNEKLAPGKYRIDAYYENEVVKTLEFTIEDDTPAPKIVIDKVTNTVVDGKSNVKVEGNSNVWSVDLTLYNSKADGTIGTTELAKETGVKAITGTNNFEHAFNLNSLSPGTYWVQARNGDTVTNYKLVIGGDSVVLSGASETSYPANTTYPVTVTSTISPLVLRVYKDNTLISQTDPFVIEGTSRVVNVPITGDGSYYVKAFTYPNDANVGNTLTFKVTETERYIYNGGGGSRPIYSGGVTTETDEIIFFLGNTAFFHNTVPKQMDVFPYLAEGTDRALIPIRFISEELGYRVEWDDSIKTAIIDNGQKKVTIKIGSDIVYVDDKPYVLDVKAEITSSRTFVPARFVAEVYGYDVEWFADEGKIRMYKEWTI